MNSDTINYPCTNFGPLRIPYYPCVEDPENPYRETDVEIIVNPEKFRIPDERVREFMEKNVKEREKQAIKEGKAFFDGPMTRLYDYVVDDENHKLILYVQPTSYFTFAFTNKRLDEDIVWQMVEKRGKEYTNLDDGLANPIGNNILVITDDGYVVLNKRSEKLSQYPGLYGILPAGFTSPEKDRHNPFNTARREAQEELGVKIKNLFLIGLGRAGDDRHSETEFIAGTNYTINEVLSTPKSGRYEAQRIIPVEFNPRKLAYYLTRTVKDIPKGAVKRGNTWIPGKSPAWVPAQWKVTVDALIKEHGFDKVYREIENAFYSAAKPIV